MRAVSVFSVDFEEVVKSQLKTRNCLYVMDSCSYFTIGVNKGFMLLRDLLTKLNSRCVLITHLNVDAKLVDTTKTLRYNYIFPFFQI